MFGPVPELLDSRHFFGFGKGRFGGKQEVWEGFSGQSTQEVR